MTKHDVFAVTWQGGGGYGDPLDRDPEAVHRDVKAAWVSKEAAKVIYGVITDGATLDAAATAKERSSVRAQRVDGLKNDASKLFKGKPFRSIGANLHLARDSRGVHVITTAGWILCTGSTRWRAGAVSKTLDALPPEYNIRLHERLAVTLHFCPASGTLLAVDVHEKGVEPVDDIVLDLGALEAAEGSRKAEAVV
jgi:N-methylhydantoinase B